MKRLISSVLMLVAGAVCVARGGYIWEYAEGKECEIGADLRLRFTHWDRSAVHPNFPSIIGTGPEVEYMRVRTRVWGSFEITPDTQLTLRVGNRVHHVSSAWWDPNNNAGNHSPDGATWNFPDEWFIDNLYLDMANLMDMDLSLRLGRQNVVLGNGMIFLEGTPYDQGRSIYFDGAVATYKTEADTLKLMALYNTYRDRTLVINDETRRLRGSDSGVLGAYWTHDINPTLSTDMYYVYSDFDDQFTDPTNPEDAERNHPADENAQLHIVGGRAFGDVNQNVGYSVEYAHEYGEAANLGGTGEQNLQGYMFDGRLMLKASEGTPMSPSLMLQYTKWSGDDTDTADDYEGWHPAFSQYPIFREELTAIMLNGNWTNLQQYRLFGTLKLRDAESFPVTLSGSYVYMKADQRDVGVMGVATGGGDHFGDLYSAFIDVGVNDYTKVALEAAHFQPGGYFDDGDASEWLRFQTVFTF